MQKKLIVLALAGLASSVAFAQTNVTIYGVADGSLDIIDVGSTNNIPGTNKSSDISTYSRISTNSSLLGFRGEEALGNGLKAIFQLESSVGFDSTAGINLNRDSFVGLNGGFGTIKLGNMTGPTRALGAAVDVYAGATGIGTNTAILGKLGNRIIGANDANSNITIGATCGRSSTCASTFDSRWKNSIAYVTPNFSGFTGAFVYVANENKTNDSASSAAERDTFGYDVGINYNNGPIMVGLTYNLATLGTASNTGLVDDASVVRLAGKYNFGKFAITGLVEQTSASFQGGQQDLDQVAWGIGAQWDVTANGRLVGQYYQAEDVDGNGNLDEGAYLASVGYEHSFSKRTMVRAIYSYLNSDRNVGYDFGVNATGANGLGGVYQGLSIGLRHSF